MNKILPKGVGYFRLDNYPLGGDFRRAAEDLEITEIIRTYPINAQTVKQLHGCTHEVVLSNGHKAAIDIHHLVITD